MQGPSQAASPRDVAAKSEIIITMLPNSAIVKTVVLGKDGVIEGARKRLDGDRHEFHFAAGKP